MRWLAGLVLACLCVASAVGQSVDGAMNIPKLTDIKIDGDPADWGDQGLRFDVLTEAVPSRKPYADHDATVRIGWCDAGLLVLADVTDASPVESAGDKTLWDGDSVEFFFLSAAKNATGFVQVIVAPGLDPAQPKLRSALLDQRSPDLKGKPVGEQVASKKMAKGYLIEALLPWDAIGVKGSTGEQVRLQMHLNDRDAGRQGVSQLLLYPEKFSRKRENTVLLQLADKPSEPVTVAASAAVERFKRVRINVAAVSGPGERKVQIGQDNSTLTLPQAQMPERLSTITVLQSIPVGAPVAPIPVAVDGKTVRTIIVPDQAKARAEAAATLPMVTSPGVFDRPSFPAIDFRSPSEAEDVLGLYSLSVRFFDHDFHEVTSPKDPGRYGAIVTVTPERGEPFNRFVTLYRTPGKMKWRPDGTLADLKLPPTFGVDNAILATMQKDVGDFTSRMIQSMSGVSDEPAVVLAGLSEMKPSTAPLVDRTGPYAINAAWWHELQKRTNTLVPYQYVTNLPKDYDHQPDTRWPLIVFLHGSGERNVPLAEVPNNGPWRFWRDKAEQPFVIVSPQCPLGQWWDPNRVNDLIDEAMSKYRVDPDRVYLTGLSMGGFGTWATAMQSPERFAAIAAVCGGGDVRDVARLKDIPTWAFHGGRDETVLPEESWRLVAALRDLHGRVRFTLYPELEHNSWNATYSNPALYDWLLKQRRGAPAQSPATMPGTQPSE